MVKKKRKGKISFFSFLLFFLLGGTIALVVLLFFSLFQFEKKYQARIYPGVKINGQLVGGWTKEEVKKYLAEKNQPFKKLKIILYFEEKIATLSGETLDLGFDENLAALQAFSVGRSGYFFSDLYQKWKSFREGINLTSLFKMKTELIEETLSSLALSIDLPASDALFQFEKGKVMAFRPSKDGQKLNREKTQKLILSHLQALSHFELLEHFEINIPLVVETVLPKFSTENSNNLGIRELLGVGSSKFLGSAASRIHNIELAALRLHGHLISPQETFSFNQTLGDVSAATGFQPAYIIKNGRTVLGDGGGICQVSTTLFRAALQAGLPIVERHPHSYRVRYYEQDSPPGLDATVYHPEYDLKFKNDTPGHLLIQTKIDKNSSILSFELYGTGDGRRVEIGKPTVNAQIPPPPDLYQDDPTLPQGTVKQVDWKAWGAKVSFDYKVWRGEEILFQKTFFSNYQPWQAVFLRGTRT